MSARSAAIFRELVSSVEPGHFEASDSPLLRQYCVAVEIAERAEQALLKDGPITAGRTSPWVITQEKSLRSIVALSQRLRLSPQARHAANRRRLPSLGDY
ncbi:MAG: P27 family phage terminase small subunit [Burkholderiales bacterium]|nr:P27 family phage terminase small subunit [Burkholderiales bacterium]